MIGYIGRWAASKGMKILPSWIGIDKTVAQTDIVAQGFKVGAVTQSDSNVSTEQTNHNKVISQIPNATTAQDYETPVGITWRNFAFTPFAVFGFSPTPPFSVFGFSPTFNVFGFSPVPPFTVFGFSPTPPFSVFGFSPTPPFSVFGFSPTTQFDLWNRHCTSRDRADGVCTGTNCSAYGSGSVTGCPQ